MMGIATRGVKRRVERRAAGQRLARSPAGARGAAGRDTLKVRVGTQLGVTEATAFISGNGTAKPKGVLACTLALTADSTRAFGSLQNLKSGASGDFDADDLIDLLYTLAPPYRKNASFVMHPSTAAFVRKLKASTSGQYKSRRGKLVVRGRGDFVIVAALTCEHQTTRVRLRLRRLDGFDIRPSVETTVAVVQ